MARYFVCPNCHLPTHKCGCRLPKVSSAQAAVEDRGASQLVGTGEGLGLGVESAEFLAAKWEERARIIDRERQHVSDYFSSITAQMNCKVMMLRECAEELRRHAALSNERQPSSNNKLTDAPTKGPSP